MTSDSTVVPLRQPDAFEDPLTAILRSGARRLLAQAVEAEAEAFLGCVHECWPTGAGDRSDLAATLDRTALRKKPCATSGSCPHQRPGLTPALILEDRSDDIMKTSAPPWPGN